MKPTFTVFAIGLLMTAPGTPPPAMAQPARSSARIGVVRNISPTDPMHRAFVESLRERGWVEGRNLTIDYLQGEVAQFPDLVRELVRRNVDVIFAPNLQQARIARDATAKIPIAPRIVRVAVLWNPAVVDKVLEWKLMQDPARALGLELRSVEVRAPADFPAAFEAIARGKTDGLITLGEPLTFGHRATIMEFARFARLPTIFNWGDTVESGALVAYGPSVADLYRRAAVYVDKILRDAQPADLPVEQPRQFELAIDVKTAKALGLTVPPSLLLRADQIVE